MSIHMQQFQQINAGQTLNQGQGPKEPLTATLFSAQKPQQAHQFQHIQLGIKNKNQPQSSYQYQGQGQGSHHKTISNASSIAYPFKTASITTHQMSQSHQKAPIGVVGKRVSENENDMSPVISIQQTSIHKSPSPRARQIKMQNNGHHVQANSNALSIGVNQLLPQQNALSRAYNKGQNQTDPKKLSQEQQNSIKIVHSNKHHQPLKEERDPISKRTIAEGFRRSDLDTNGGVFHNRAQTGLQRRFDSQKGQRAIGAIIPAGMTVKNKQVVNHDFHNLGSNVLEKLGEDSGMQMMQFNEYQRHMVSSQARMDKNQIMHLYRMSMGQSKIGNHEQQAMMVNQILATEPSIDKKGQGHKKRQSLTQMGQPPKSANSGGQNFANVQMNNTGNAQANSKRGEVSQNFVSQQQSSGTQQKPIVTSQEKLRRNLSKEYCPMIIKSSNKKGQQGVYSEQIVKSVLQSDKKARVESSLKKTQASAQQQHRMQQYSVQNNSIPISQPPDYQHQKQGSNFEQILKAQSQQVLLHSQTTSKRERRYTQHEQDEESVVSPVAGDKSKKSLQQFADFENGNTRIVQQSLDDVAVKSPQMISSEIEMMASTNVHMKLDSLITPTNKHDTVLAHSEQRPQSRVDAINEDKTVVNIDSPVRGQDQTANEFNFNEALKNERHVTMLKHVSVEQKTESQIQRHPGSVMTTIKSPANQNAQELYLQKQMTAQHTATPLNITNGKMSTSMEVQGIVSGHTTGSHMNSRTRMQQQNLRQGSSVANVHPAQYKLTSQSQQMSGKPHMHQAQVAETKINRRPTGVRGSSTLVQHNSNTNNNANSQTKQPVSDKQSRAASHNRNIPARQQDVGAAGTTASGGFLRPKVLDFQPKTGQVDPLLAHRSRKRGAFGVGNSQNHNAPAINMSTGTAFNQNHHYTGGARFNAGSGVFRHF